MLLAVSLDCEFRKSFCLSFNKNVIFDNFFLCDEWFMDLNVFVWLNKIEVARVRIRF